MTMDPCAFYRSKEIITSKNPMPVDGNTRQYKIVRREWCLHPKAYGFQAVIGPSVPCRGDLEKCMIHSYEWNSP
jgi:hypothetical protein